MEWIYLGTTATQNVIISAKPKNEIELKQLVLINENKYLAFLDVELFNPGDLLSNYKKAQLEQYEKSKIVPGSFIENGPTKHSKKLYVDPDTTTPYPNKSSKFEINFYILFFGLTILGVFYF